MTTDITVDDLLREIGLLNVELKTVRQQNIQILQKNAELVATNDNLRAAAASLGDKAKTAKARHSAVKKAK